MPHLGENSFFWQIPKGLSEEEREYYKVNATEMCDIFGALFTDGVTAEHMLENDKQTDKDVIGSSLAVIPGDGLNIVVSIGSAMVNKHLYIATLPIQIPVTVGTNDVLLRCDTTTEKPFVTAIVRKRTSTELTDNVNRTANVHEVPIATVTIPTGSQTVSETMIVDQRLNTNLASDGKPFCGLMKPRPNADTKGIWEDWTRLQAEIINTWKTFEEKTKQEWETQKQGFNNDFDLIVKKFNAQIADNQKTFVEWFENLQTYLEGDVAANLAGEITKLKINKADKNTVYTKQEIDSKLSEKTDLSVTTQLSEKVDFTRTYTLTHTKLGTVHTLSDLPTGQGIYQCQFIAQADYTEGDTFTDYTAKPTGEETILPDKAFVKGDIVSVLVDTVNKKLGFKIGGSGVNQTLPPQIRSFAVTSGNAQNKLSWLLPVDTSAYEGLVIVRKVGSAPTKVSDGTKIELSKTSISYTDTGLTNDTKYYYRAFPYNSKKQYQTELIGAVVSGTPKGTMLLSELPVGTLIKDVNTKYYGAPIVWKIADQNHSGYPANSTTLISDKILTLKCFDAKEPSNSDNDRRNSGNNRYLYSNIRQWLNSSASAGNWYSPQHSADAPPNTSNVTSNAYDTQTGFINDFSSQFINSLLSTTLTVVRPNIDGRGSETVQDKVFLLSNTEVGLANENSIAEGTKLALFSDNNSRISKVTAACVANSNYSSNPAADAPWHWWLRTPYHTLSDVSHLVYFDGTKLSSSTRSGHYGIRPLCNIKNDTFVSLQPDTDGAYIIQF